MQSVEEARHQHGSYCLASCATSMGEIGWLLNVAAVSTVTAVSTANVGKREVPSDKIELTLCQLSLIAGLGQSDELPVRERDRATCAVSYSRKGHFVADPA